MASNHQVRRKSAATTEEPGERRPDPPRPDAPADLPIGSGVLELTPKGFGFLRSPERKYHAHPTDPYVSAEVVRRFGLRPGLLIEGGLRPPRGHGGPQLAMIQSVDGMTIEEYADVPAFADLVSIAPEERIVLETTPDRLTARVVDLISPIGRGQRGLIVAPPRAGKTVLLQEIAHAVAENHPDIEIYVWLIDERPEEVTEMRRIIRGEVIASSNDQGVESHVRTVRLAAEISRRKIECGKDVLVLLDSLTRLGRAFNKYVGNSGRTMTGGLDTRALDEPKRMFGAARKAEHGGSLTIMATALIETGSRMDDFIFQEFKGTGNMELVLDRKLSEKRIWPAVNIPQSGTRKEERLYPDSEIEKIHILRRELSGLKPEEAMEAVLNALKRFKTNKELLTNLKIM